MRLTDLDQNSRITLHAAQNFVARTAIERAAAAGLLTIKKDSHGVKTVLVGDLQRLEQRFDDARDALSWARHARLMRAHNGRASVGELVEAARLKASWEAGCRRHAERGQGDLWGYQR